MSDEWRELLLNESIVTSRPDDVDAAYWGDYAAEEYALGRTGSAMGLIAAIGLLEGDFSYAIQLLESNDAEIPPVFLGTILELLKGQATVPSTQENIKFEIGKIKGKRGAPKKSSDLSTVYKNLKIGSEMYKLYQVNGEKYEWAAKKVAKLFGVSLSTVRTVYSWYKNEVEKRSE